MGKSASLGVDIGSISTKGVILDDENAVLTEGYLWTEGDPVNAVRSLVGLLAGRLPEVNITAVGTTGSARKLIGAMLEADVIKNEITAHAIGALSRHPDVRTILEIGGQDSKIILLEDGVVIDYAMNTLCAAGTGAFLASQAKRLGLAVEEMGEIAMRSQNPTRIAARCTVFAESDLVHKVQAGHSKENLVAGLCSAVVSNYLNNVGKGKTIRPPVIFQGGVSKNRGVVAAFHRELGLDICVDDGSHLMGAVGAAILARSSRNGRKFDPSIVDMEYTTATQDCPGCANHCELINFYREGELLDTWGNRCERMSGREAAGVKQVSGYPDVLSKE